MYLGVAIIHHCGPSKGYTHVLGGNKCKVTPPLSCQKDSSNKCGHPSTTVKQQGGKSSSVKAQISSRASNEKSPGKNGPYFFKKQVDFGGNVISSSM